MPSPVFVGLDCGGTATRVVAADASGSVLFRGQGGAANLASTPDDVIVSSLRKATDGCPNPVAVCGCFAGLLTSSDRERAIRLVGDRFPGAEVRVEVDAAAAFYAAEPKPDMCVIAGTGSLVCSEGPEGLIRSGGRGYLLGDEGSAFQVGRDAVRHYLDDPDAASEMLREEIEAVFGEVDAFALVAAVYRADRPAAALAQVAQAVGKDAKAGEPYARESIKRHAAALSVVASDHATRYLSMATHLRIALAGGVWKILGMTEAFASDMTEALPARVIKVEVSRRPPVMGAVALAMEIKLGN